MNMKENGIMRTSMVMFIILLLIAGAFTIFITDMLSADEEARGNVEELEKNAKDTEGTRSDEMGLIFFLRGYWESSFWGYSTQDNKWTQKANFPWSVASYSSNQMAYDGDDTIYAMGQQYSQNWAKYSISANKWTQMSPNLPYNPYYYSPGLTYDNGYIYYHPGYQTSSFYRYNIQSEQWESRAGTSIHYPYGSSIVAGGGYIYKTRGNYYSDWDRYNPGSNQWTRINSLPSTPYYGSNLCFDGDNSVWYFSGYSNHYMYKYSISGNNWQHRTSAPTQAHFGACMASDGNNNIYYAKGNGYTDFYRYTDGGSWKSLANLPGHSGYGSAMVYTVESPHSEYGGGPGGQEIAKIYADSSGYVRYYRYRPYSVYHNTNIYIRAYHNYYYATRYRGFVGFDTTALADYEIDSLKLKMYLNYESNNNYARVREMNVNPKGQTNQYSMWDWCAQGNVIDNSWDWNNAGKWLEKDLMGRMTQVKSNNWYALGFQHIYETSNYNYAYCAGLNYDNSRKPHLEVTYTVPDSPRYYIETFTDPLYGDKETVFGQAWSRDPEDDDHNGQVDTKEETYDAHDDSRFCWRMDTANKGNSLNEMVFHIGLLDATTLDLSFATRAYGDDHTPDPMDSTFVGSMNADGIAVSTDGDSWTRLWQYPANVNSWTVYDNLQDIADVINIRDKEDLYIKFQQYGDGAIPGAGILWDTVRLESDIEAVFLFDAPGMEREAGLTENLIFATDQGGDDGIERTEVQITMEGTGGNEPGAIKGFRTKVHNEDTRTSSGTRYGNSRNLVYDSDGNIYFCYGVYSYSNYRNRIYVAKSTDSGETWSQHWVSNGYNCENYDNYAPAIAMDSNENLHVSWQSYRYDMNYQYKIFYSKSTNGASSWSTPQVVNTEYGRCYDSSIAVDSNDNVFVAYRWYNYPNYDIWTSRLKSGSSSWQTKKLDDVGGYRYYAYDPSIAIDGSDRIFIAFREYTNYGSWPSGYYHRVAVAHSDSAAGSNSYSSSSWTVTDIEKSQYYYYQYKYYTCAAIADDDDQTVYVTYKCNWGNYEIAVGRSSDHGSSWTKKTVYNPNGYSGNYWPSCALDGKGTLWVSWYGYGTGSGTNSYDIWITGSEDKGDTWEYKAESISDPEMSSEYYPSLLYQNGRCELKKGYAIAYSGYKEGEWNVWLYADRVHPEWGGEAETKAATDIEVTLELATELKMDETTLTIPYDEGESDPATGHYVWYPEDLDPNIEIEIFFEIYSDGEPFGGTRSGESIGPLSVKWLDWKDDSFEKTIDAEFDLTVRATVDITMEMEAIGDIAEGWRDRIIANNSDGTLLTGFCWDQAQEEMPLQDLHWSSDFDALVATMTQYDDDEAPPEVDEINEAHIIAAKNTVGTSGSIIIELEATGVTWDKPKTITHGPAKEAKTYPADFYPVGKTGMITAGIFDAFENPIPTYEGKMYASVREPEAEVTWMDLMGPGDDGYAPDPGFEGKQYYEFTAADKGTYTFSFVPYTWMGNEKTTLVFQTITGMDSERLIKVSAGRVETLEIAYDIERMLVENPDWDGTTFYAGDPVYIQVTAHDMLGNPTSLPDDMIPLLVSHTNQGAGGMLEPDPWQSIEGDFIINVDDWVKEYRPFPAQYVEIIVGKNPVSPDDLPIKFYEAGTWEINVRSKWNMSLKDSIPILVTATSVDELMSIPAGTLENPVEVLAGEKQDFDVEAYDEYGNLISDLNLDVAWSADGEIEHDMNEQTGELTAIQFFAPEDYPGYIGYVADGYKYDDDGNILYSYIDGDVHATVTGPEGFQSATETIDVPTRVLNDYDVWVDEAEFWPNHVLANQPLELKANVHYNLPVGKLISNVFEVQITFALIELDGNGDEIPENTYILHQKNIQFTDLTEETAVGVYEYSYTVPQEFFKDYVNYIRKSMNDADKKPNYMKVMIADVPGGADMKEFQKSPMNDEAVIQLFVVVPTPASSPSFAPSIAFVGIALLGLAVGSTVMSRRRKKGRGKDDDAVSPVIAIILMVAITIVLAGVLWLWVSGLVATGKEETLYKGFQSEWIEKTENKDYQLLIKAVDGKNELSVEDLRFTLYALDKSDQTGGQHKVTNVYGKPISDQTFISFHDGDHDGMLSIGDRFIIKSFEHVNDDGTIPDGDLQGKAKEGFTFELRAGKTQLFETKVK